MLSKYIFALLATVTAVAAVPVPADDEELHLLRRDAPLSERDLDLARRHDIDLDKMYAHSVFKRDDGDHVTIWIDNSFIPEDSEVDERDIDAAVKLAGVKKRQAQPLRGLITGGCSDCCGDSTFNSRTDGNAPFTGGVQLLINWGNSNRGSFQIRQLEVENFKDLIVAGTNSGANLRFRARRWRDIPAWIGTTDITDLTRDSRNKFQRNINGRWRFGANGYMFCRSVFNGQGDGGIVWPVPDATATTLWEIVRYDANV